MKLLLLLLVSALMVQAQNAGIETKPASPKPQFTLQQSEQSIPKPAEYRIVDGKLYNITTSTNWLRIPTSAQSLEFKETIPEGAIFQGLTVSPTGEKVYGLKCLVKNYPDASKLAEGAIISNMMVLPKYQLFDYKQTQIGICDYGLPGKPAANDATSQVSTNK